MVASCAMSKCSDKHKRDDKFGYSRLSAVRKDADTKTFELSRKRRRASVGDENQQTK